MDDALAAVCCICHDSSSWFYENISMLQSKHSEKSIAAVLKLIMGEELAADWTASDAVCFECVDKINDYDDAFEKMQLIERELKQLHQNIKVKHENEDTSVFDVTTMSDAGEMNFDDGAGDSASESSNDPLNETPLTRSPQPIDCHKRRTNQDSGAVTAFDCDQCGKTLLSSVGLAMHVLYKHKKSSPGGCDYCGVDVGDAKTLTEHKELHLSRPNFQCIECERVVQSKKSLKQHMRIHTGEKPYPCSQCDKRFTQSTSMKKHMKLHLRTATATIIPTKIVCQFCLRTFATPKYLKAHMEHKHPNEMEPQFKCKYCGVEFDDDEKLANHTEQHMNRPDFQCIECEVIFKRKAHLKSHMTTHTALKQCNICGEGFINWNLLQTHIKSHNKSLDAECYICKHRTVSEIKLREHMRVAHPPFECTVCGKRFAEEIHLNIHTHIHFGPMQTQKGKLDCEQCERKFGGRAALATHMRFKHKTELKWLCECNYCGVEFADDETLNEHKKRHLNRPNFQCIECERVFTIKSGLKKHMPRHSCEKLYECSECDKRFALESNRNLHLRTHFAKKDTRIDCHHCGEKFASQNKLLIHSKQFHKQPGRFKCRICRKAFPNEHLLETHAAAASCGQADFKCPTCKKCFILPHNFKIHMDKHRRGVQKKTTVKCDYCGIVLSNLEMLSEHKMQHQNRPEFQCLECDFMGNTNYQLKRHMRIHTKVLRHQCDKCGKAFYDSSSLHSHLQYHNKDLNVECYICKVKTMTVNQMEVHMRRHTGEKPFQCSECGKRFARNGNLNSHLRLHYRTK